MVPLRTALFLAIAGSFSCVGEGTPVVRPLTLFAASSTTGILSEVAGRFTQRTGQRIALSFASSATLARQISAGAPADLIVSADPVWIDRLLEQGSIQPSTRRTLFGNRLVLVAPRDERFEAELTPGFPLDRAFKGRIAIGDPAHVPVGIYAQAGLKHLGQWSKLRARVLGSLDARAALALVERGEVDAGIVYATDAAASERVEIVARFPEGSHPPIRYEAALCRDATKGAAELLAFLLADEAAGIFREAGFLAIGTGAP